MQLGGPMGHDAPPDQSAMGTHDISRKETGVVHLPRLTGNIRIVAIRFRTTHQPLASHLYPSTVSSSHQASLQGRAAQKALREAIRGMRPSSVPTFCFLLMRKRDFHLPTEIRHLHRTSDAIRSVEKDGACQDPPQLVANTELPGFTLMRA